MNLLYAPTTLPQEKIVAQQQPRTLILLEIRVDLCYFTLRFKVIKATKVSTILLHIFQIFR